MDDTSYNTLINALALKLAQAIALAEGFYVQGSLPQRTHNPGDLELGDRGWGVVQAKTVYAKADWDAAIDDHSDGCSALRRECTVVLTGVSREIPVSFTFEQLAAKYTGNDNAGAWCRIVTEKLVVNPVATIAEWVKTEQEDANDESAG